MAILFKPFKITKSQLSSTAISEGRFIICIDTKEMYLDVNNNTRVLIKGEDDIKGTFTLATTDWVADETYEGYGYVATINISGVVATDVPDIYYDEASRDIATEASANLPDSAAGGLNIYAENIPSGSISGTYIIKKVGGSV